MPDRAIASIAEAEPVQPIAHALVLNLHQPAGNLEDLLAHREWEAREILYALDRIPRFLWEFEDIGRVHLAVSGVLLETLASPAFQRRVYGIVDCGSLLWYLQNPRILQILGTAFYHAVLPLVPQEDSREQIERWLGIARHLFWRTDFPGFWPPEMGFSMELIPQLKRAGYRWALVDGPYVEPEGPMRWEELRYRPHLARFGGEQIIVVVRDRELSDAQESGMDYAWFDREVRARTRWCDFEPLVTTCTDGDNGGWFRNVDRAANFWGAFYGELLSRARSDRTAIQPVFIDDYLRTHGAHGYVTVRTGAWNTGWHHGADFTQWTGSCSQREALDRVRALSGAIHEARAYAGEAGGRRIAGLPEEIEASLWHLLRAETSCNFYWGDAWVSRAHAELDQAERHRRRAWELLH